MWQARILLIALLLSSCTSAHHAGEAPMSSSSSPPLVPKPTESEAAAGSSLPSPSGGAQSARTQGKAAGRADVVPIPAATYVGRFQLRPGPLVPVLTLGQQGVLLPSGRTFRISEWQGGGLAACNQVAADPSGVWFAYTAAHLILRVVDTRTGKVWALGKGCAPTWGAGGLAYMSTDNITTADGRYRSQVVVRRTPLAPGRVWDAGEPAPLMWVGRQLLVTSSVLPIRQRPTLELLKAPEEPAVLPVNGQAGVIERRPLAVSPAGTTLLVEADGLGARPVPIMRDLELVDLHSRRVVASFRPPGFDGVRSAAWVGSDLILANQTDDQISNQPDAGLARVHVVRGHLQVEEVATTTVARGSNPEFDYYENLQSAANGRFVAVHHQQAGANLVSCVTATLRCTAIVGLGQ